MNGMKRLLENAAFELIPMKTTLEKAQILPLGTTVSITASPVETYPVGAALVPELPAAVDDSPRLLVAGALADLVEDQFRALFDQHPEGGTDQGLGHGKPDMLGVRVETVEVRLVQQLVSLHDHQSIRVIGLKQVGQRQRPPVQVGKLALADSHLRWLAETADRALAGNHYHVQWRPGIAEGPPVERMHPVVAHGDLGLRRRRKPAHRHDRLVGRQQDRHKGKPCKQLLAY